MAFASATVTVATTATALHASDADGQSLLVSNVGAATVYLFAILAVILTNGG